MKIGCPLIVLYLATLRNKQISIFHRQDRLHHSKIFNLNIHFSMYELVSSFYRLLAARHLHLNALPIPYAATCVWGEWIYGAKLMDTVVGA